MKANTIKIVYPKHFIIGFNIESEQKIDAVELISYLKERGILQADQDISSYCLFQTDNGGSFSKVTECSQGKYFLSEGEETTQIQQYTNKLLEQQQTNTRNSLEEQKTWAKKQQKIKQERERLSKIKVPQIKKKPSRRRLVTPTRKPIKIESQQQNIQSSKLNNSEILTKKTVSLHEEGSATTKINKKNILNIMKLAQSNQENETVSIKYFLGKILLLEQNVKKMSVIRNKLRDLYEIYQDEELTKQVKKVTIALHDRQFFCKRRAEINNRYNKEDQFIEQSHRENPEQNKSIFRISKKRQAKNQNNQQPSHEETPQHAQKQQTSSIFHVRRTVNMAENSKKKL